MFWMHLASHPKGRVSVRKFALVTLVHMQLQTVVDLFYSLLSLSSLLSMCIGNNVTPSDHSTSPILSRRSPRAMQLSFSSPTISEHQNLFNMSCRYQRGLKQQSKKFKVSAKSVKLSLRTLPVSFHAPGPDSVPKANMFRLHPRGITGQVG